LYSKDCDYISAKEENPLFIVLLIEYKSGISGY